MSQNAAAFEAKSAPPTKSWFVGLSLANRIALGIGLVLLALIPLDVDQAKESAIFAGRSMISLAPAFLLSVAFASGAKATGADALTARAFSGRQSRMVVLAALFGALSPFCSCGVVPVIAGLLGAGVPLAPVMAFWLSSPLMDPNMFVMTAANLGFEFAVAKTLSAVTIGLFGGFAVMIAGAHGIFDGALRFGSPTGCAAKAALAPKPPVWKFWQDPARVETFLSESWKNGWYLFRWLLLAFLLESLMLRFVPGEAVAEYLGDDGALAIPAAVALGIPAYLNGYAAIPLVKGLIDLGMNPAVGMAFVLAGGVTSIPAMMAVYALVKPRLFAAYLVLAIAGATLAAYAYAGWQMLQPW